MLLWCGMVVIVGFGGVSDGLDLLCNLGIECRGMIDGIIYSSIG